MQQATNSSTAAPLPTGHHRRRLAQQQQQQQQQDASPPPQGGSSSGQEGALPALLANRAPFMSAGGLSLLLNSKFSTVQQVAAYSIMVAMMRNAGKCSAVLPRLHTYEHSCAYASCPDLTRFPRCFLLCCVVTAATFAAVMSTTSSDGPSRTEHLDPANEGRCARGWS